MAGDWENIRTEQRFTTRQDQDRFGKSSQVVQELKRLPRGEIRLHQLFAHFQPPTMHAFKIAPGSGFPEQQTQGMPLTC